VELGRRTGGRSGRVIELIGVRMPEPVRLRKLGTDTPLFSFAKDPILLRSSCFRLLPSTSNRCFNFSSPRRLICHRPHRGNEFGRAAPRRVIRRAVGLDQIHRQPVAQKFKCRHRRRRGRLAHSSSLKRDDRNTNRAVALLNIFEYKLLLAMVIFYRNHPRVHGA
jgi:hypothetical protein